METAKILYTVGFASRQAAGKLIAQDFQLACSENTKGWVAEVSDYKARGRSGGNKTSSARKKLTEKGQSRGVEFERVRYESDDGDRKGGKDRDKEAGKLPLPCQLTTSA